MTNKKTSNIISWVMIIAGFLFLISEIINYFNDEKVSVLYLIISIAIIAAGIVYRYKPM